MDFLALVITGRWPEIACISAAAVSTRFLSCVASPTPMLMTIFSSLGTSKRFLYPNFSVIALTMRSSYSTLSSASISAASAFSASPTRSTSICSVAGSSASSTFFSLSAMDQLSRLGRDADLFAAALLETDAGGFAPLGIGDRDVRHMQRRFLALDPALRVRLRRLAVAGVDVDARHDHLVRLGHGTSDLAGLALVLAGQNDDRVALADLRGGHG